MQLFYLLDQVEKAWKRHQLRKHRKLQHSQRSQNATKNIAKYTKNDKSFPPQHPLPNVSHTSTYQDAQRIAKPDILTATQKTTTFYPIPKKLTSQTGARKSENLPCLQIAIIMRDPSFVLQAAKPSWLTATEGSFGFCFLDQSRDIRFCLNYLGSISSQMDSTTWKAGCISRLSKQLVREAKLTKTYAQRCYYRLDPSFTITAKSKTLARLSLWITIFTWNAMIWKLSIAAIAAWHPAVQKIICVHPRIVGPNQAPKPNTCFGF